MKERKQFWLRLLLPTGLAGGLLLLLLLTAVAQSHNPAHGSLPNVIFITVDTLRSDHVSSYGYGRSTTPNLDALVTNQGVRFAQATTPSSWTFPSNAALLSGLRPSTLGVNWADPNAAIPDDTVMLAEHLRDAGYYTAGFITAHYARGRFGFDQGFDIYEELAGNAGTTTDAEEINALVMNWLDTQWTPVVSGTQPLFLYLYYYDPHSWYNPPAPYDTLYDPTYTGTLTADIYRDGQDIVSGAIVPTPRDIEHILALYDGEITYWDASFADMMSYLEDLSLLDNAIIVVTSDHGEMFGEHGHWAHGSSLYEESLRVPLLLRYTGVVSPGVVITTPVQTMDIMPTILDLLNLPITPDLESTSLLPLVQGAPISETRDVFSELYANRDSWIASDFQLRAVRQGDWKYIHHIGLTNADELYMVQPQSLYETDNLLFTEPEEADSLWQLLLETYHLPTPQIYLPSVRR